MIRYLLDTDTCIALLRGRPAVVERASQVSPDDCALSSITLFELFAGVEKCARPAAERIKVDALARTLTSLDFGAAAAVESAKIRATLEGKGQTIGPYDLLIAGHAFSLGLALVTHNVREFSRVAGLSSEDWM